MIAIYHALPVAHVVAMGVQFWIYSFKNKGYNENACLIAGNIAHEVVEINLNIVFARIDKLFYETKDSAKKDEGFFGDLTLSKFLAKAASSFSLTKIVDLALPINNLIKYGASENIANGIHFVASGLAGVIGTEIPEWFEDYQHTN